MNTEKKAQWSSLWISQWFALASFIFLLTTSTILLAEPFQQDSSNNGLVVMEAENHDGNTPLSGRSWIEVFSPTGYSGTSAYQTQPTCCLKFTLDYASLSPRLDYQVNFTHTGTHYVWLYARGDTSANNSLHAGLDGAETTTASGIDIPAGAGWIWTTDRGSGLVATLEIVTPGVHTINVWMREDGAYIDKLLLTTNAAYVPTGLEPESPRGTGNQVPTADAGGPYGGIQGSAILFDGSASFDPDGDALTYSWDFGDGNLGSGVSPSHSYAVAGDYTVRLTVNDGTVNSPPSTTTANIASLSGNQVPTADAGGPYSGVEGSAILFDGSASFDPDGDALTYSWDFGDGNLGSGMSPSHSYAVAGDYTVRLTVNDGTVNSPSSTTTASISPLVINQPPSADAGGPYSGVEGSAILFDGSASFDPDGDALTYSWDFGDGNLGSGMSPSHSYAVAGDYTVTLIVNDGMLGSLPANARVTVSAINEGTGAFEQDTGADGLVVMEAENHDGNTPLSGRSWIEVFSPTGYSGTSAYQTQPTCCLKFTVDYASLSPRLDYQVNFTHTGTHYVWLYARGDTSANNSLHAGLDGAETTTASGIDIPAGAGWIWTTDRGSGLVATLEIVTPGVHTINVWMREDGAYIDKLLLTTNAAYVPTGLEPESPRGTGNQVPTADAGGPYGGIQGSAILFDGSASFDPDGDALTYSWDFGDGNLGSGVSPSHSYAVAGDYTVRLTVNDGTVNSPPSTTTANIASLSGNQVPTADAGGPYSGVEGSAILFDGSASFDPDGDALTYSWDFGDGNLGSGMSPSHSYAVAGDYTVRLTVNDGTVNSPSSTTTASISPLVINQPPSADAGGPYSGVEGSAILFDGSASFDPDGDALTYSWDFGDGNLGSGMSPSHSYAVAGDYTVTLIVNDGTLGSLPANARVTVSAINEGTGAFEQDTGADGLVVMEAENHDGNTPLSGRSWIEVFSPTGYSGTSAYQTQPTCCLKFTAGLCESESAAGLSGELYPYGHALCLAVCPG